MSRAIAAVLALMLLATGGVVALDVTLEDAAGPQQTVINETWTVNKSNVTVLNNSGITGAYYNDTVTVRNSTDDNMTNGVDYAWFQSNGTVKALAGGNLTDGNDANITYGWRNTTQDQRNMVNIASVVPRILALTFPILFLVLFFIIMGGG